MAKIIKMDKNKESQNTTSPSACSSDDEIESLRVSEQRYRRLFESAKDGILILDAETGVVVDVNPYLMDLLGYSREQFIGATIWDLGFIKNVVANKENFETLKNELYIRYEDMPLEAHDGRRIDVEFVSNVYLESEANVIQCNIRDISERKRVEHELKQYRECLEELVEERTEELLRAQEQLIQSQKMDAVGQLAGGISHDFNNILAIIIGTSEVVLATMSPEDPNQARMRRIIKSAMRAKNITSRLLTFARKEKLEISNASARDILIDTLDILRVSVPNNIEITTPDCDVLIRGDANQLGQAFLNICANACDAMTEEGKLEIMSAPVYLDNEFCRSRRGIKPGEYCLVAISDEGSGIPADMLDRIFEPFFTTKEKGSGTGLGLSVTMSIIETHNGLIEVESEPGKGTKVNVYLPCAKEASAADKPEADEALRKGEKETILIVDDEKDFTDTMSDFLILQGYRVITANGGKEALDLFRKNQADVRLVILDMMMPRMDGAEIFAALRKIRNDVKVILCSGFSVAGKAMRLMNDGACAFVQKPFDGEVLLKTISETLAK